MRQIVTLVIVGSLLGTGCVGKKKYDAALAESASLSEQLAAAQASAAAAETQAAEMTALEAETRKALEESDAKVQAMQADQQRMKATFAAEIESKEMEVEMMQTGVRISLASDVLFKSGQVAPDPKGVEILKKAAEQLAGTPYQVIVVGHTDDVAVGGALASKYPTNWELAAARAAAVGRVLIDGGVKPEQLAIGSRASYKPLVPNDTPEGKAQNRRIEIFVRYIDMLESEDQM